jgi:hypothetical protein
MADSFTKLLLHANGVDGSKEIQDSGNTGHIVTQNGTTPTLSLAQAKFGICSMLLNGSDNYLTAPDHADWDLVKDTTNYTIHFWVKHTDHAGVEGYIQQNEDGNNHWEITHNHGSGLKFEVVSGSASIIDTGAAGEITDTNWHHVALVKTSTTYSLYLDGTRVGTVTDASTDTFAGDLYIGKERVSYLDGYMDEVVISQDNHLGAASSATCTVPTTARTSDANTKLLLHMESLDTSSTTAPKIPTFVGTAQLDTAQYKDLTGYTTTRASLLLDGDSDYVTIPDSADWDFTADYTIEMWIKTADKTTDTTYRRLYNHGTQGVAADLDLYILNTTGAISVCIGTETSAITGTTDISDNNWHHIALARSGSNTKLFVDGVQDGSTFSGSEDLTNAANLCIGAYLPATNGRFNGYLDEIRISKGIARWTANFTPPTSEYGTWKGRAILI